ncbi:hypothetical protein SESBI_20612 [Sesbania bispinosa]|nr:hypothetical protein SESBI_20612 [Sesbania bispinosa]
MSSNSNASQVRVLGSSSSGPNYDWVLPEVLEKAFEYLAPESVQRFREDYDLDGAPQFPLYWTTNPSRIVGLSESDLSDRAKSEVEFLKSLKKKAISCSDVIDAEGDPSALTRLLGNYFKF